MFEVKGKHIRMSAGDTGQLIVQTSGAALTDADRAVLCVKQEAGAAGVLVEKTVVPTEEGLCIFAFENEDTENLDAGLYMWDVRFVFSAVLDADGRVTGGEQVITPFAPQIFEIVGVVGDV